MAPPVRLAWRAAGWQSQMSLRPVLFGTRLPDHRAAAVGRRPSQVVVPVSGERDVSHEAEVRGWFLIDWPAGSIISGGGRFTPRRWLRRVRSRRV